MDRQTQREAGCIPRGVGGRVCYDECWITSAASGYQDLRNVELVLDGRGEGREEGNGYALVEVG